MVTILNPDEILRFLPWFKEDYRQMVIVKDIENLFHVRASYAALLSARPIVAYIPNGYIVWTEQNTKSGRCFCPSVTVSGKA